ncbi:integrase [Streptomyces sp. fd1-xmd]|nr:integrase [Streptomyces sp. fd1-xmd]
MLGAGGSVVSLARRLGHSSATITLGYNARFMPEAGSKGRGTIGGLLREREDRRAGRNSPDSPRRR